MTLSTAQIDLVRTLQASLPLLQTDEIDAHLDYNKFLGDAGATFDSVIENAISNKYENPRDFIADLRSIYTRALGWYFSASYRPLRAQLYNILDTITYTLSNETTPFVDIAKCREALDRIYQYETGTARRFAFSPDRYAENVIAEWQGSTMSLFNVLVKLETYQYKTVAEFASELRVVGSTLVEKGTSATPRTLFEMAQFIVDVADNLVEKKTYAASASKHSKPASDVLPKDSLRRREFGRLDVSPVWKLAPVPKDETPYSQHIRRLMKEFEVWVADVPLDNFELLKKTASGETLDEWKRSAKKIRGSTKGVKEYVKNGKDEDAYRSLEYCWISFLHLLERERLASIQSRNVRAMKEHRETRGVASAQFIGKEGPLYRASIQYNRDILCQYHPDFYKFWGQTPTWALAEAVIAYNNRDEDYHDHVMERKVGEYLKDNYYEGMHSELEKIHGGEIDESARGEAILALKDEVGADACRMWTDFSKWLKEDKLRIRQSSGIIVHEYRKMRSAEDIRGELLTASEMDKILETFIIS